jgi:hypothetical protein
MEFFVEKIYNGSEYQILSSYVEKNERGKIKYANFLCQSLIKKDTYFIISTLSIFSIYSFFNSKKSYKNKIHEFVFLKYDDAMKAFQQFNQWMHVKQINRKATENMVIPSFYLKEPYLRFRSSNRLWSGEQPPFLSKNSYHHEIQNFYSIAFDIIMMFNFLDDDVNDNIQKGELVQLSEHEFFAEMTEHQSLLDSVLDNHNLIKNIQHIEIWKYFEEDFVRYCILKNYFSDSDVKMIVTINNPPKKEDVLKMFQQ